MARAAFVPYGCCYKLGLCLLWVLSAFGQQILNGPQIPPNFKFDLETAARLRPQLVAQSIPATGRYGTGRLVFERLLGQVPGPSVTKFAWELRIVDDDQLNASSSPDGTIYVETGLARLAGSNAGLWAAILSHEVAHIVRRDWARRYLYQKSLESSGAAAIVMGDPGQPSASWIDSEKASENLGRFCRQMEVEADREGLMLMVRAGYHPAFVPALHHLLHAQGSGATAVSLYAMHPCWEERDRELSRVYVAASIEFEHRWPEWYASPGGNPPVVVFAETPTVRKTGSKEWEIRIPMRCENLAGAVEVVLRADSASRNVAQPEHFRDQPDSDFELRQLTGCTSPQTTITFTLADSSDRSKGGVHWTDVYVLDAWGAVLTRANVPKLPH
ncbi:MAG: M48 family metalloprotease [Candidatus Sulfotelmatobacter sp.]